MKRVFSSLDSAEVGLLQGVLEVANIPNEIRNLTGSQVAGPSLLIPTELWVLNDEDYDEATRLLDRSPSGANGEDKAADPSQPPGAE